MVINREKVVGVTRDGDNAEPITVIINEGSYALWLYLGLTVYRLQHSLSQEGPGDHQYIDPYH